MLPQFSYVAARNKQEALSSLASLTGAALLAGGTDLLVRMKKGETHRYVIDLGGVAELAGVTEGDGTLRIGGGTTHGRIAIHPTVGRTCASLASACSLVGSPQIRNMGTLGGNLVNASPAADSIAPLLVHDAVVTLESMDGERAETLSRFIAGPYRTTIGSREILTSVKVETLDGYHEGYRRIARRAGWAISRLSLAWAMRDADGIFTDVRIAVGSCTPVPFRPRSAEAFLIGKGRKKPVVEEAVKMVLDEIRRIAGMRPSFAYKLPVVRDLLLSVLGGGACS
jgi:CO/xanthine dehydrogenase FAD-binding subunit